MLLYKGFISDIPNEQCQCDAIASWMTVFLLGHLCRLDHGQAIPGLISTTALCKSHSNYTGGSESATYT